LPLGGVTEYAFIFVHGSSSRHDSVGGRWSLPSPSQPMLFRTVCFELQPLW